MIDDLKEGMGGLLVYGRYLKSLFGLQSISNCYALPVNEWKQRWDCSSMKVDARGTSTAVF